jgi:hypothetical protein
MGAAFSVAEGVSELALEPDADGAERAGAAPLGL